MHGEMIYYTEYYSENVSDVGIVGMIILKGNLEH